MDELDQKLNATFDGKVLRKDLLHRIKKGTNVPTFVLEFLLAKYCASNDQAELDAGMEAVLSSLQENYVRPDEANAAQSKVATKGKHRFIDKVHVRYVEKEKRHWASLENFNSQRIAIGEKFYRDNDRLLEGGIWAEVTLVHNDIDEDDDGRLWIATSGGLYVVEPGSEVLSHRADVARGLVSDHVASVLVDGLLGQHQLKRVELRVALGDPRQRLLDQLDRRDLARAAARVDAGPGLRRPDHRARARRAPDRGRRLR